MSLNIEFATWLLKSTKYIIEVSLTSMLVQKVKVYILEKVYIKKGHHMLINLFKVRLFTLLHTYILIILQNFTGFS